MSPAPLVEKRPAKDCCLCHSSVLDNMFKDHISIKEMTDRIDKKLDGIRMQVLDHSTSIDKFHVRLEKIENHILEIRSALVGNKAWKQTGFIAETRKNISEIECLIETLFKRTSRTSNRRLYLIVILAIVGVVGAKELLMFVFK